MCAAQPLNTKALGQSWQQNMQLTFQAALLLTTNPKKFENLRFACCTRLHEQTLRLREIYHFTGLNALMRNAVLRFSSDETILGRMAWIYGS